MDSNTIFTIADGSISVKLDKAEISILNYIEGWLPTFTDWSVEELALKCDMFAADATAAIDMLILYGLIDCQRLRQTCASNCGRCAMATDECRDNKKY